MDSSGEMSEVTVEKMQDTAEKGDAEAQLWLGRHYKNIAEVDSDTGHNAKLAVYWLIKSSRQGNIEATACLQDCLFKQLGVDESNSDDITWCINTPPYEKVARKAARDLFRQIRCMVGGSDADHIQKQEFKRGVAELAKNKSEKKLLEKAGNIGSAGDDVTEDDFVNKLVRRLQGHGSSVTSGIQSDSDWEAFKVASFKDKVMHYPTKTLSWLVEATIDTAGSQGAYWLRSLIPINQIYTLVAVLLYSAISLDAVLWLLPLIVFYLSFAVLAIVTAQMLRSRRRLSDIRTLSSVLSRMTETFDCDSAASTYSWNSLKPYAVFFVTLPICVASLNTADDAWLPCPELAALSTASALTCFIALSDSYDFLAIISISIDVMSITLPALVRSLPEIPVIHSILWYVIGPGLAVELPIRGMHFMIGVPSLSFLIVPLLFVLMAARRSWRGTYQILVPHLVCFFWWRLAVAFLCRSTWFGLARAVIGWVSFVILLPFITVLLIIYAGYVLFNMMSFPNILKIVTTVLLVVGASAYAMWSHSGFRLGSYFSLDGKSPLSRAALIVVLIVGLCIPLAYIFAPPSDATHDRVDMLSWDIYRRHCLLPSATVSSCTHFSGAHVVAAGRVSQISVVRVENPGEAFASWLPSPAAAYLRCAYGSAYPSDCSNLTDVALRDACVFNNARGRSCHMRDLDRYTYEISVVVSDGDDLVRLTAEDWFRKPAKYITVDSEVSFNAIVPNSVGRSTTLSLHGINCTSCLREIIDNSNFQRKGSWQPLILLITAVHAVWNFFLAPIIVFS